MQGIYIVRKTIYIYEKTRNDSVKNYDLLSFYHGWIAYVEYNGNAGLYADKPMFRVNYLISNTFVCSFLHQRFVQPWQQILREK